ncbi:MAG: NADH:ubiquinone oxidoreductase [Rickettsiales bacterium]|nr:NADH:ubiquinone oxidoreductase [Rickettsiales bacterium]
MNVLFFLLIFILGNEINAMNLLEEKKNQVNSFLEGWEFVSDQVMGGVSTGKLELHGDGKEKFLRLKGNVSTKNNGGFIQFRSSFDIINDDYKGIRLKVRGIPSDYFVHIRTKFLFLPWQYYSGRFSVESDWQEVEILFEDFKKSNFYQPSEFDASEIDSIGFVAFGKDFEAELDVIEATIF